MKNCWNLELCFYFYVRIFISYYLEIIVDKRILVFKDLTNDKGLTKFYLEDEEKSKFIKEISPGLKVIHKRFGEGEVFQVENSIISVIFKGELKKFPFPDVFTEGYIKKI